jgi:hypothetical protein
MSDFCDFVPDDPSCQPEPEPVTPGPDGPGGPGGKADGMDGDMMGDDMGSNPMMGNLVFLHIALGGALHSGLKLFRYTTDTMYDSGTANDTLTNFWEYNHLATNYFMLATHTVLFITQALSMAGIAGEINLMAWMYVNMASGIFALFLMLFRMYAYDTYYTTATDTDASNATAAAYAAVALSGLETDMLEESAMNSAAMLMAYMHYKDWMHAQVMALPEEVQGKYKKGHGKMEHDDEGMEKMQEFGLFVI